jgi:DNA invertase Pin-like site-specific DNA recombinase
MSAFRVFGYGRASTVLHILSTQQQQSVVFAGFQQRVNDKPDWREAIWVDFLADEATPVQACYFHKRPAGSMTLAATQPGDVIIVSSCDRLFHGGSEVSWTIARLNKMQIRLVIVDIGVEIATAVGSNMNTLIARIVAKSRAIETRITNHAACSSKKRIGRPHNTAPIGWQIKSFIVPGIPKNQKYFVPDHAARRVASAINQIRIENNLSYNKAKIFCNENGILRDSRKWNQHVFERWCNAARDGFILSNGSHESAPIPPDANPFHCGTDTIDD